MVTARRQKVSWCLIVLGFSACSEGTQSDEGGDETMAASGTGSTSNGTTGEESGGDSTEPTSGGDSGSAATQTGDPNRLPSVMSEVCSVAQPDTLELEAPGVLANDSDPDGDALVARAEDLSALGATVAMMADGSFRYEAPTTVWGVDRVSYEVDDGAGGTAMGEVVVTVHPVQAELSGVRTGSGGFSIEGAAPTEAAGTSLAAGGDINGDGLGDILVGAPNADAAGEDAGRVYVVFGKADHESVSLFDVARGQGGFVVEAENAGDLLGTAVAGVGDLDGDGLDDIIVGAPSADAAGEDAGRAYIVLGKADGTSVELSEAGRRADVVALDGELAGDRFGFEMVGLEDLDGDGRPDFAISAVDADEAAGRIYVVFTPDVLSALDLGAVAQGTGGVLLTGEVTLDRAGTSLARATDMNEDGRAELVVGAPGAGLGGNNNSGRAYVVFGPDSGAVVGLESIVAGTGGFAIEGEAENDLAGDAVAGGFDYNGDGRGDVLVGAFTADGSAQSAGRTYLVHGKNDGATVALSDILGSDGGFALYGSRFEDASGFSVAFVGDHDADGQVDLAVGAPAADGDTQNAGRVYVLLQPPLDVGVTELDEVPDGIGGFSLTGDWGSGFAGAALSWLGDVDGDGVDDFGVGAPGAPSSVGGTAGRVSVLFGASRRPHGPTCER